MNLEWVKQLRYFSATLLVLGAVLVATGCTSTSNSPASDDSPVPLADDKDTLAQWKADPQYQNPVTVPYEELFRNAEKYKGQFVRLKGEVIQVLGESGNWNLRVNVTEKSDYGYTSYSDTVLVFSYSPERVIEKDIIEFTAKANGVETYESTLGASITIPSFIAFETPIVGRKE